MNAVRHRIAGLFKLTEGKTARAGAAAAASTAGAAAATSTGVADMALKQLSTRSSSNAQSACREAEEASVGSRVQQKSAAGSNHEEERVEWGVTRDAKSAEVVVGARSAEVARE